MDIRTLWRAASNSTRFIWIAAGLSLSGVSTLLGMVALIGFNQAPGAVGPTPSGWPSASSIRVSGRAKTLLVFVHPFCSCSVASINELETLAPQKNDLETTVVFYRPKNSGWKPGSLWRRVASEIHGAHIVWDDDGREASLFGARTSGYTLLYGPGGDKLFGGGVTGSRGHEGDNFGIAALRASILTGLPADRPATVFGCALSANRISANPRSGDF